MIGGSGQRIDHLLLRACARFGDSPALSLGDSTVSYSELATRAEFIRTALGCARHSPGEPVLVAVENRPGDFVCELAAWTAGATVIPVHRNSPAALLLETAERTGARLLLSDPAHLTPAWTAVLSGTDAACTTWVNPLPKADSRVPAEIDADQALVVFTSGSTGRPKGVVLSHRAFTAKLAAINSILPFRPGDRMLHVLHLNFSFGQWTSLLTLATGGTLHLVPRFDAAEALRQLASHGMDRTAVVPSMLRLLCRELEQSEEGRQLCEQLAKSGSPGLWIAGGEPLSAGLGRHLRSLLPKSGVADVFGLSESSTSDFILAPEQYDAGTGSIGRPSPGVAFRIVARDGSECRSGEAGELWLRTPYLMTGYLDDPRATAGTMSEDWLRTGDLARIRPGDGLVELVGRAKQLIVRGGAKISPLEVEAAYGDHPECAGCLAVGVPDDLVNERVHLLFVPRTGALPGLDDLRAWGRARLEPYKVPEKVHVVSELPLGRTGKVDRIAAQGIAIRKTGEART